MGLALEDTRIVLVRPRNPLNIGAAARAMRNFGLRDLVIVAAYEPVWQDARAAPGAAELLRSVRVVSRLLDVLEDRTLVLGTSSLARRRVTQPTYSLNQLASFAKKRPATERLAILFGSEKTGLSNQDLSHCHGILRIPTEPNCPTMNLGQSVAVCCYELQQAVKPDHAKTPNPPPRATVGEVTRLIAELESLLNDGAERKGKSEPARTVHLREMLLRLRLRSQDVTLLLGVLRDIKNRERGNRDSVSGLRRSGNSP